MAFAVQVLAGRFAFLLIHLSLLLPNPAELGNRKHADGVEVHAKRCGDPHLACGWVDTQMDVLDVLLHHVHGNLTEVDSRDHQYSFCWLTMRKMRSTSPTSCNTSCRALLMASSFAWTPRHASCRAVLTASSIRRARSRSLLRLL